MKITTFLFFIGMLFAGNAATATVYFTAAGSTIAIMDSVGGAREISVEDAYTREHTPFDLSIRLNKKAGLTERDYLKTAAANVHNWSAEEQASLRSLFGSVDSFAKASGVNLHLPDTIMMIKTDTKEEFGAEGYTRTNHIILNTNVQPLSLHLITHELFHVISRYNKQLRDAAYASFGFKPCNNIVYKPALNNKVITNPDCPYLIHYVTVTIEGKPQDVAIILYSKVDFHEGYTMNEYANIGLLALTGNDAQKKPKLKDGKPVIYDLEKVPDLFNHIGRNTQYIIHIEEITAEHFAAMITGDKMEERKYVDAVAAAFKNN